jgi:hypothetical protein
MADLGNIFPYLWTAGVAGMMEAPQALRSLLVQAIQILRSEGCLSIGVVGVSLGEETIIVIQEQVQSGSLGNGKPEEDWFCVWTAGSRQWAITRHGDVQRRAYVQFQCQQLVVWQQPHHHSDIGQVSNVDLGQGFSTF